MSVGIPIKLLHEAEGQIVTIELKNYEVLRGFLDETEDNFNMHVTNITRTEKDGRVTHLDHAYVRGSQIRFMILPDMLKNAPMFRKRDIPAGAPVMQEREERQGGRGGGRRQ